MPKIRKQHRKKRFRANVNRKRLRNKLQKLPKIECEDIENSWELKRSIRTNLKDMGLAYDPNEVLKIPSTRRGTIKVVKRDKNGVPKEIEIEKEDDDDEDEISENNNYLKRDKIHVVNKLEADAKAPRERLFRLPKSQVQFVTYLMEKYGEDYKAMARDRKNHYQMTWCQIRNKINSFKSIPEQYGEYLLKTGEIVLDDPETLEETKRKLGEENLKKYCAPKKRKIQEPKSKESFWEVESIENDKEEEEKEEEESFNIKEKKTETSNGLKKLKLFSDDELSEDDEEGNGERKKKRKKNEGNGENEKLESKEIVKNKNKKKEIDESNSFPLIGDRNVTKAEKLNNKRIEKSQSSDSDSEEFEGDDDADGFINLSDMEEDEELSEDDVLDDGEFVTDTENESD